MKLENILYVQSNVEDLIRLGSANDGGYVVSKAAIDKSEVVYTYGVGSNYDFEKDYVIKYPEKNCKMYDHTINLFKPDYDNIQLFKDGLFSDINTNSFINHIDTNKDYSKFLFLKIDTEGAEYDFLTNINLKNFEYVEGMVIEFHNLQNSIFLEKFKYIIQKLYDIYDIVHIHGNNHTSLLHFNNTFLFPSTPEISFVKKNLNPCKNINKKIYPLPELDKPNNLQAADQYFSI